MVERDLKQFNVETRIVVGDFSKNANLSYYNDLMSQVTDIDIGLVVLNAGVGHGGPFEEASIDTLE